MKRIMIILICGIFLMSTCDGCCAKAEPPVLSPCLNIGNSLDAPKGQSWGLPMNADYFSIIRKAGFRCVRLPVRFSDYVGGRSSGYLLDEDFMKQIDGYINTALSQHLTLILDLHHFLPIMSNPEGNKDCLIAIWKQLAARYKKYPNTLVFEILNEPHGDLDSATWNNLLADTIKVIRKVDRNHFLIVGGTDYNSVDGLQSLELPDDARLIATIHYYEPNNVTFQGDFDLGETYGNLKDVTWDGTAQEVAYLKNRLKTAKIWADKHDVPLFLGEFGVNQNAPAETRVRWTRAVANEAKTLGISYGYWEFASSFGIYDCGTGRWNNDMLSAILHPEE